MVENNPREAGCRERLRVFLFSTSLLGYVERGLKTKRFLSCVPVRRKGHNTQAQGSTQRNNVVETYSMCRVECIQKGNKKPRDHHRYKIGRGFLQGLCYIK